MANNRTYEVMYIAAPETADDDVLKLNDTFVQLIEKEGGSVVSTGNGPARISPAEVITPPVRRRASCVPSRVP